MADQEQAVVDQTDTESQKTSVEEGGAQDDLDTLLSQWESSTDDTSDTSGQADDSDSDPKKKLDRIEQHLQRVEQERAQETVQRDLESTAKTMKEAISDQMDVPEDVLKEVLHGRAAMDSRVLSAWNNRHRDKASWDKTASAIARDFAKKLRTNLDDSATEDREAVASAVRGASKAPSAEQGPSEKDFEKMSDAEFNKRIRELM